MTDLHFVVDLAKHKHTLDDWSHQSIIVNILGKSNTVKTCLNHVHLHIPSRIDPQLVSLKVKSIEANTYKYDRHPSSLITSVISRLIGKKITTYYRVLDTIQSNLWVL